MCLACEMDALWFAEIEAAAKAPGTAGVSPARPDGPTTPTPDSPQKAGGTKVGPARLWHSEMSKSATADFDPAAPGFVCEEIRSE
jgi:hypothetical protein